MTKQTNNTLKVEWATWAVVSFVYSFWLVLIFQFNYFSWLFSVPAMVFTLTLHSSLTHEIIHGHPTKSRIINNLIAYPAIGIIFPYTIFRETHLKHHNKQDITYPGIDPESFFYTQKQWQSMGYFAKSFAWINMTLLGRLLLGPATSIGSLIKESMRTFKIGSLGRKTMWLFHYVFILTLLWVLHTRFSIPAWLYFAICYFSLSFIFLRSFYEHRPVSDASARSVIQNSGIFFELLFLNNNYHAVHHENPDMPWYKISTEYKKNKSKYLTENQGFYFKGYRQWLKFLFKPIHAPVHPFL